MWNNVQGTLRAAVVNVTIRKANEKPLCSAIGERLNRAKDICQCKLCLTIHDGGHKAESGRQ